MNIVSQRVTQVSAALIVAALSLGLVIPKVAGFGFLALALVSIVWLTWNRAWFDGQLIALERLFVSFIALFVGIWVLAWWGHGLDPAGFDAIGRMMRLLLIVPIFLFLRRADGLDRAWWSGLTAAGLITGGFAWWFFITGQTATFESRVEGATNPIYFGGVALAIAVMLIAKLGDDTLSFPSKLLVGLSIAMAFGASLLSGSRGAWLALAPMVGLYVMTLGQRQRPLWRFGLPAMAALGAIWALLIPQIPTSTRLIEGFGELLQLTQGTMTEGALGRRWHMWSIALESIKGHLIGGIGPGTFAQHLQDAIATGKASELLQPYTHPHNQYLSALTDGGLFLLLAFVLLLATAARRFFRLFSSGLQETRQLGWAGLSAITLLAVMALSESIFERNVGIVWFGLLSAASMGLVHASRRRELANASPASRTETLSVVVIAKNEQDRIGRCLDAVCGWADEVIVLDSGSTDQTVEIANGFGAIVQETDWPGYGAQKQRALEMASKDWILSVDADEVVSEELKKEIDHILSQASSSEANKDIRFDAYTLPWLTHAFGQTLQHGRWSRTPLRLMRKGTGAFSDVPVHESIVLFAGKTSGHLDGPLHHWPYRDIEHAKTKLSSYARLHASNGGQRKSASMALASFKAVVTWIDNMVLRAGVLDGRGGFILSGLLARYRFEKYRNKASSNDS